MRNTATFFFLFFVCLSHAQPHGSIESPITTHRIGNKEETKEGDIAMAIIPESLNEQRNITEARLIQSTELSSDDRFILGGSKKEDKGMEQMYMMFMMFKALISTLLMFVSPIIQVKGFFLSVIGTLINIAKFVMYLKEYKQRQGQAQGQHGSMGGMSLWQEEDRIGNHHQHYPQYPAGVIKRISERQ